LKELEVLSLVPDRPRTRWASPPYWLQPKNPALENAKPVLALNSAGTGRDQKPGGGERNSRNALLLLLEKDIQRGNRNVAIRHYLMLRGLGITPAPGIRDVCERFMDECSTKQMSRIGRCVEAWFELCRPETANVMQLTPGEI
jgi:hypothetical protein